MSEVHQLRPRHEHDAVAAEQQLLGAILLDNGLFDRVSDVVTEQDFFDPIHAKVFAICARRITRGHLASAPALAPILADDEGLRQLGGPAYLVRLAGSAISPNMVRDYAHLVVEHSCRRRLSQAAQEAASRIEAGDDAAEVKAGLQQALYALPEGAGQESSVSFLSATTKAMENANLAYQGATTFLKTGVEPLDKVLRGLAPGDLMLLGGATSMGKAQPLDSLVLTATGWKPMWAVQIGDDLASIDGQRSKVVGVFPQGQKQIYRVRFSDGRSVRCCGDHLWRVEGSAPKKPKTLSTLELIEKMKLPTYKGRISVPLFLGDFGDAAVLPLDPWVLGAFIGNGHFPNAGSPMFSTADAATLWKMRGQLPPGCEIVAAAGYDYRIKAAGRAASAFATALDDMGLRGCSAETKFIPEAYLSADRTVRLALLQGLMDTDGWVEKFGAVRYSTSSLKLSEQVAYLVRSLGGVCSVSVKKPKFTYQGEKKIGLDHYVLNIRHPDNASLFTVLQKRRRCQRARPVRLGIISIDLDGTAAAQCIAISHPSHLYVTDDFVMTHNTSLALEIAGNVAIRQQKRVGFWSLEMTDDQLATRMASAVSRVPYAAIRDAGEMEEGDFRKWVDAAMEMNTAPMRIVPRHIRDMAAGHAAMRRIKREFQGQLDLVIVDYAQLIRGQGKSRFEQMTDVSLGLKALAGLLECPVIALVQLSREIGARDDKRPQLTDIKETGQFENDADQVVFCHREGYWMERQGAKPGRDGVVTDTARAEFEADLKAVKNVMELIVRKNRHGRLATCQVGFHDATNRFWTLKHDTQSSQEDF